MSGKRVKKKRRTPTTKKILWLCLLNGLLWVWCSYALAFLAALRDHQHRGITQHRGHHGDHRRGAGVLHKGTV